MNRSFRVLAVTLLLVSLVAGCGSPAGSCNATTEIAGPGTPSIVLTSVPSIGSSNNLKGQVSHVSPAGYYVSAYIYVAGGWWIKPYDANPETAINCDGTFSIDITTGGVDPEATVITAFLLPLGFEPLLVNGQATLPQSLYSNAAAVTSVRR